ncbi:MAG: U32 family peptidase, partial [Sulfurovaceae bacterium]|nr:U32 family peptidase [Sulfurovaceae bacterium]
IDSLKIEGRTKSSYYAGVVTKAYRHAIDDFYADDFIEERYQKELHTTQNRGFSDAYLVSKPFERNNTQSHNFTIQDGTHQVAALVSEDGKTWRCKDKTSVGDSIEIVLPIGVTIDEMENDECKIEKKDNAFYITFKKIVSTTGKEFESIHSGDLNDIILPVQLPSYTILRRGIVEAKESKGLA